MPASEAWPCWATPTGPTTPRTASSSSTSNNPTNFERTYNTAYGAARIVIEGHTDGSMRGSVPESAVVELSSNRALSVKQAIVRKFPELDPNQFSTQGMGWKRPAEPTDADNHARNRRVEVKVYPLEAQ
jgi:flagellar motor protein MotB